MPFSRLNDLKLLVRSDLCGLDDPEVLSVALLFLIAGNPLGRIICENQHDHKDYQDYNKLKYTLEPSLGNEKSHNRNSFSL